MMPFDKEIRYLKGIGEKRAELFAKLGVFTIRDLIFHFPRDYEDRRTLTDIANIVPGMSVCVRAIVTTPAKVMRSAGGATFVRFRISDGTAVADVTFFNQTWVKNSVKVGCEYIFYGLFQKWERSPISLVNPVFEPAGEDGESGKNTGRIMPVYRLTAGIGQHQMRKTVQGAVSKFADNAVEILPQRIRDRYLLQNVSFCLKNIHFPDDDHKLLEARRRFAFEELFLLSLGMRLMRGKRRENGYVVPLCKLTEFTEKLAFELTGAQRRAIEDASRDMASGVPMNRLVQGDVGSGKTMVAAAAAWMAFRAGLQSAVMAPTEILAVQHYETLSKLFETLGMKTALLTGSMPAAKKREISARIAAGEVDVAIGTHALITDSVVFNKLGLVITDEQHRFGVAQRSALALKGENAHMLVMSATPIPRTLALMLYGDLDISRIDELPPGRRPVKTFAVDESYRERIENFIRRLVGEGRQVFVVCPLVEDAEGLDDGRKAVEAYAKRLSEDVFPDLKVGFIHGRLKQKKKDEIMAAMAAGEIDILVATTVIEVGIDIPNAALMVVENSERFGLAQLHQLRGRVGRGKHESFCVLFENGGGEVTKERIKVMCESNDGFKIAEADLKLRGPGDFFGSRQHGIPTLKVADIAADTEIMHHASEAAGIVLGDDPNLEDPENELIRKAVERMFSASGGLN